MKMPLKLAVLILLQIIAGPQLSTVFAQGSLTPPGAPAPTMKTLDQLEPRIAITSVPMSIYSPGSYYLVTNLTMASAGAAIILYTNDVSIDLNGFTLYGNPSAQAIAQYNAGAANRVSIRNGKLVGWGSGVYLTIYTTPTNCQIADLVVTGTGAVFSYGIVAGYDATVARCTVTGFSGSSSSGIALNGDRGIIQSCLVADCAAGISTGSYALVADCSVRNCLNGYGIFTFSSCTVRNNVVDGCLGGIRVSSSCIVAGNNCQNSVSARAGIDVLGSTDRIEDNLLNHNGYGIQTGNSTTNNFVVRNFASGNTTANYNFIGTVAAGPIVTGTGTIATNNPWANFSY
jgi:parallel beta-helix repeat protein